MRRINTVKVYYPLFNAFWNMRYGSKSVSYTHLDVYKRQHTHRKLKIPGDNICGVINRTLGSQT